MTRRNRSEGWTHAKRSGHALEEQLAAALGSNPSLSSALHEDCFGVADDSSATVIAGGIDATHDACVLGGHTPSKADLVVRWKSGRVARISLKKSEGGQVWLVTTDRFIAGFEAQFGQRIPELVRQGLRLFIGPLSPTEMLRALDQRVPLGPTRKKDGKPQEIHQGRFVASTLEVIAPQAWSATLDWFCEEVPRIVELCFARGLCAAPDAQAEFVWYYICDERSGSLQESRVIPIASIVNAAANLPKSRRAVVGPRNGGSTITLPVGFLQMHRPAGENQLQFHHGLGSVKALLGL
jgi:hypothetical protein